MVLLREQLEEQSHRIEHLSSLLMGKDNYILELRARMSGTITEFEELKECLSVRAVSDPASLIAQLQYSESYLKQQLAHIQALQSDSEKVENGVAGIPNITIRQRMDKLEKDISDACTNLQDLVGSTRVTTQEILEYGDLLEPLIRRVFNSEVIGMDETFSEDVDVQSSLLRALVAASICASVFEGSVFELLEHDSILLNKYRECLRRKGLCTDQEAKSLIILQTN